MKEPSPTDSQETRAVKTKETLKMESTGQLYNEEAEYTAAGYRKNYMLRYRVPVSGSTYLDVNNQTVISPEYQVAPFSNFIMYLHAEAVDAPTDLYINLQFSPDRGHWYNLQDGVFGGMIIPAGASPIDECYSGVMLGRWLRVRLYAANLQGQGAWKVSIEGEVLQP